MMKKLLSVLALLNPYTWILSVAGWIRRVYFVIREVKTHERQILATRDVLARELRQNAQVLESYERDEWMMGNTQSMLRTERWHETATKWSVLRSSNEELWEEVADAYEAIQRTKDMAAEPPVSTNLVDLAGRLCEAKI
jgi:hypothetical protein